MDRREHFSPMLAAAVSEIPVAMPGGVVFEPKFDGWRGLIHRTETGCRVLSRRGRDVSDCFPDVLEVACAQLEPGTVVDGELVIWRDGGLDFTALSERMGARGSCQQLAARYPASFMAFDLLRVGGVDLRRQRFATRRSTLEGLADGWCPPLQLTPQTADLATARRWLRDYAAADVGVEGLVAKGLGQSYRGGVRGWRKVRIRHPREAVVGGVLGAVTAPRALVLGLPSVDGGLRVAGVTLPVSSSQAASMALVPSTGGHPWPAGMSWRGFGAGPTPVTLVGGLPVVEVSADTAFERGRWRHPTRFLRMRPELSLRDLAFLHEGAAS